MKIYNREGEREENEDNKKPIKREKAERRRGKKPCGTPYPQEVDGNLTRLHSCSSWQAGGGGALEKALII